MSVFCFIQTPRWTWLHLESEGEYILSRCSHVHPDIQAGPEELRAGPPDVPGPPSLPGPFRPPRLQGPPPSLPPPAPPPLPPGCPQLPRRCCGGCSRHQHLQLMAPAMAFLPGQQLEQHVDAVSGEPKRWLHLSPREEGDQNRHLVIQLRVPMHRALVLYQRKYTF